MDGEENPNIDQSPSHGGAMEDDQMDAMEMSQLNDSPGGDEVGSMGGSPGEDGEDQDHHSAEGDDDEEVEEP